MCVRVHAHACMRVSMVLLFLTFLVSQVLASDKYEAKVRRMLVLGTGLAKLQIVVFKTEKFN